MNVYLTSISPLKTAVLAEALKTLFGSDYVLHTVNTNNIAKPPQPINYGIQVCANKRIEALEFGTPIHPNGIIISIENGLLIENNNISDVCIVVIKSQNNFQTLHQSHKINVPMKYYQMAVNQTPNDYPLKHLGLAITIGELIHNEFSYIDPSNWMANYKFGSNDRRAQIMEPLKQCIIDYMKHIIKSNILYFNDFPKKGVIFKDLSKIMQDKQMFQYLVQCMKHTVCKHLELNKIGKIDKIVGLDSRGFIVGSLLAQCLNIGFVMARKHGKLPAVAMSVDYGTEYSNDTIEIMPNMIQPGDNVIIADDLIATGGSIDAAKQLIQKLNGNVIAACCIHQVNQLIETARKKLNETPLIIILE
jgi:adenine phosphoribosyltransferase